MAWDGVQQKLTLGIQSPTGIMSHVAVDVARFNARDSPLRRGVEDAIPVIRDTLARGRKAVAPLAPRHHSEGTATSDLAGGMFVWEVELAKIAAGDAVDADAVSACFKAFERWIYSGNGFSSERYAKLKLERPDVPDSVRDDARRDADADADVAGDVAGAVGHGLEALRAREHIAHAPGAITNPSAYRPGGIANPHRA